jgi:hypothetical protein
MYEHRRAAMSIVKILIKSRWKEKLMSKGALVLCVLGLLAIVSAPAMADTTTWLGGAPGTLADGATPAASDWYTASNWASGAIGTPSWQQLFLGGPNDYSWTYVTPDVVISSTSATNSMNYNANFGGTYPILGTIYDEYVGNFSIGGNSGWTGESGVVLSPGCNLNLNNSGSTTPLTCTVPVNTTLTLGYHPALVTVSGGGTVDVSSDYETANVTVTDNSAIVANANGFTFASLTGGSQATLTISKSTYFTTAGFAFTGQITTSGFVEFSTGGPAIVGANLKQLGGSAGASSFLWLNTPNQIFTSCKFSGDGIMLATSPVAPDPGYWWYLDTVNTVTSQGSAFAPSATNTPGGTFANGQMTFIGNLVCAKDATGKNTQFVLSVTGTTGLVGSGYTRFATSSVLPGAGGGIANSITSADTASTHNALDEADLVVNITTGLSPSVHSVTDLGTAKDPFAGQILDVIHSDGSDLSTSSFAHIKLVGGSATVSIVPNGSGGSDVELSNIFSNPTLAGDINNDGLVDVADYNIWAANVGKTGATWLQGDLNGDGLVDVADYNIWAANVGKTAATPEPISMIILAIGGGLVALRRNRV